MTGPAPGSADNLHVYAVPLRTRFRGIDVRQGVLVRGPAGWGEFSPFREYDDAEAVAWWTAAREGGGRWLAAAGAWNVFRSTPPFRLWNRTTWPPCWRDFLAAGRPRSRWPTGSESGRRRVQGWRPSVPCSARAAVSASTPTVHGTSTPRPGCSRDTTSRPEAWSTPSSPARAWRIWPPFDAAWRCRSRPTSRSGGPAIRRGGPAGGGGRRRAQGAAAERSPRLPAHRRETSGCRSWCRAHWRRRSGSLRVSRWRPPCRNFRTHAASRRLGCSARRRRRPTARGRRVARRPPPRADRGSLPPRARTTRRSRGGGSGHRVARLAA